VLDEISRSDSHQGNPKLDQTRYTSKTPYHDFVDLKVIKLLLSVCALCEEERYVIMDCPFLPFHIRVGIVGHVELQNLAGTLMDQPQEHELGILVVQNILRGIELGSQLGL
jgi:hypothetical protein